MNKDKLIDTVWLKSKLQKKDVRAAIQATIDVIRETLQHEEKVVVVNFGAFETVERKARLVRNVQTGQMMEVPPMKTVCFKAGKQLKDRLNGQTPC